MSQIILVEGNIAAGKSTLLESLKEKLAGQVHTFSEPVELWRAWKSAANGKTYNLLEKSYRERNTFSFPFQVFVMATYLEKFKESYQQFKSSGKRYFIMERSLITTTTVFGRQLRRENRLSDEEFQILTYLSTQILSEIPHFATVDIVFYIRLSPEDCQQRLRLRGRSEEDEIPLSYLNDLHELYEDWCDKGFKPLNPKKVVVLDGAQGKAKLRGEVNRMLG